jgi:hypothetical protein
MRWANRREIRGERTPAGEWRVHLGDVLERATTGEAVSPEDMADEVTPGTLHAQLNQFLKTALRHNETLLEPVRKYLESLGGENDRLRARCNDLEARWEHSLEKWESSLSLEHERRLVEAREARQAAREEKVMRTLLDWMPAVTMGMAGHFGLGGMQEQILTDMIGKMTEEQIRKIVLSGALTPEQLAVLERLRVTRRAAEDKKREAAAAAAKKNDGDSKAA